MWKERAETTWERGVVVKLISKTSSCIRPIALQFPQKSRLVLCCARKYSKFVLRPLDGLFFWKGSFFLDYLCKLKKWASFQDECYSNEIYDCKTISKTTSQIFQPRDMLKCLKIIRKKNTNLIIYCLEKKPMGFLSRWDSSQD